MVQHFLLTDTFDENWYIGEKRCTNGGLPILLVPVKNDSIMNFFRKKRMST